VFVPDGAMVFTQRGGVKTDRFAKAVRGPLVIVLSKKATPLAEEIGARWSNGRFSW